METKEKKSKSFILVLLISLIILSLGLAAYIVYNRHINKKDDNNNTNNKAIQGYYYGSKTMQYNKDDDIKYLVTIKIGLFNNKDAIISINLGEFDGRTYKCYYSISSDGDILLSLDNRFYSPIKYITIEKKDVSYIFNLKNYYDLPKEDISKSAMEVLHIEKESIYLNKTSDKDIKENLDNDLKEYYN